MPTIQLLTKRRQDQAISRLPVMPDRRRQQLTTQAQLAHGLILVAALGIAITGAGWSPVVRLVLLALGTALLAGVIGAEVAFVQGWLYWRRRTQVQDFWVVFEHLDKDSQAQIKTVLDQATVRA